MIGYYIGDDEYEYVECMSDCEDCSDNEDCNECMEGFGKDTDGMCYACSLDKATMCTFDDVNNESATVCEE